MPSVVRALERTGNRIPEGEFREEMFCYGIFEMIALHLVKLAELLMISAGIVKSASDSNPERGYISKETEISRQLEIIANQILALAKSRH